ncbi:FecR domain-containing protein [uncultured Sanguibacteroides sp.]|uniref:FecR family protein n=1 Tax=uncultured Sanguibacteroides sp. TaxID=1635151 RepID=UPI0025F30BC5|nr:FecR domain-containing protein [uncultured Sanguibacteroides sp.]
MSEENIKIADVIFAYIRGTITGVERERLQEWLEASTKHKQIFESIILSSSFRDKQEIYRRFDVYYDYDRIGKKIARKKRFLIKRYISVAAMILFLVSSGVFYWLHDFSGKNISVPSRMLFPGKPVASLILSDGSTRNLGKDSFRLTEGNQQLTNKRNTLVYERNSFVSTDTVEKYHEIRVPRGGEYQLVMSDGTHAWLNAESSIRYPVVFKKGERNIWVSGEVFLEVAKDSVHPFVVHHPELDIRVLGTKFNIRGYKDEGEVVTTLVEGQIAIGFKQGEKIILSPFEQLTYHVKEKKGRVDIVDTELYTSWKDGVYLFKTQRLEDIMKLISKWYDVNVVYRDEKVKDIVFSGRLKRYENAESLLCVFEKLGEIKFVIQDNTVVVCSD